MTALLDHSVPRTPHTIWCDTHACYVDGDFGVQHRSPGLTLGSERTGILSVFAGRSDDVNDYRRLHELGTPYIEFQMDIRHLWSDHWLLPDDNDAVTVTLDMTPNDAAWLGYALLLHVEAARTTGYRIGCNQYLGTYDDRFAVFASRLAITGYSLVTVRMSAKNFWSSHNYATPDAGNLTLTLTVDDAEQIGRALTVEATHAGWDAATNPAEDMPECNGIDLGNGTTFYPELPGGAL